VIGVVKCPWILNDSQILAVIVVVAIVWVFRVEDRRQKRMPEQKKGLVGVLAAVNNILIQV
jgi:hypothetical protein